MKILFGKSHYGRDTSEVPSGFLIWIIEEYEKADWSLIQACKKELSERLKLDWSPKTDRERDLETALKLSTKQVDKLLNETEHLKMVIMMSTINKGNEVQLEAYLNCPELLKAHLELITEANLHG